MEFYSCIFPTNSMKQAVVQMYVAVMKLLDDAVVYYRSGKISMTLEASREKWSVN